MRSPLLDESNSHARMARIVAVGVLLLALAIAAGCQSVKASSRTPLADAPSVVQRVGTPVDADADPSDREAPEDTSPDPSVDATPVFAPVPPHALQPLFDATKYLGRPVTFVPNDKHEVAITFDDGPSKNTLTILRILHEHGAHATFFMVVKRAEVNDAAVVSVVTGGDEVANHTWSHRSLRHLDASMTATQIDRSQAVLAAETSVSPPFVRPRGGKFDEGGRMALVDRGLIMALWSIHANDIFPSPTPAQIVKNVVKPAKPGSIILMHETNDNTVLALPKILNELRAKGLHQVTLSRLLADGHP